MDGDKLAQGPIEITEREAFNFLNEYAAGGGAIALIVAALAIYQLTTGSASLEPTVFLIAAVLSLTILPAYAIVMPMYLAGQHVTVLALLANWSMLLPWALACALLLYKALWPLRALLEHFDIWLLVRSVLWAVVAYRLVDRTWLMTEFTAAQRAGRIRILAN